MPVFASGYVHPSDRKAFAMLGLGRDTVRTFTRTPSDAWTVGLEARARELDGAPAVMVASAGEVNAGDFDPLPEMADLAERFDAWLHVDGAFGLFAALSDRTRHLVDGVERADSVIADGHKWLNVPYDCGFAFVRDASAARWGLHVGGGLPADPLDPKPTWGYLGPEMSRRARAFAVWATLRAYGRSGYRRDRGTASRPRAASGRAGGRGAGPRAPRRRPAEHRVLPLPTARRRRGSARRPEPGDRRGGDPGRARVLRDHGVRRKVAFRPAPVNWRNRPEDVELIVDVVREVGAGSPGTLRG